VYFKTEIAAALPRLREAKLPGGLSLSFEAELSQAKQLSVTVEATPSSSAEKAAQSEPVARSEINARLIELRLAPSPSGLDLEYYRAVAQRDPNLALAGIRIELEIAARNLAKGFGVQFDPKDSVSLLFSRLQSAGAVGADQAELTRRVLRLCNLAVHGQPTSEVQATEVITIAGVLIKDYVAWLSWGFQSGDFPKSVA
jgi:hypothetical protein